MKAFPVILASAALLAGCAMSASGLSNSNVELTLTSTKTAEAWATCVAESLVGDSQLRGSGNHYWVLRMNGYGVPMIRWDFTDLPSGGSRVERRASISIGTAGDKIRRCGGSPA